MSKKVNVYSAETALGALEVRGKQVFAPKNRGDIPDPLFIAYDMDFLLNGEKFAECGIYQITKDKKQGFTDVQGDSEEVLLYCDGQDEDLGEIAYQLFHNSVDRPDLPIDTFMLLSDLTFVSAKPELAMECIKGIFHNQHDFDAKHPARYVTYIEEEKTTAFDQLKAAGIPFFYCNEPMCVTEDYVIAVYDCKAFEDKNSLDAMNAIEENPEPDEDEAD